MLKMKSQRVFADNFNKCVRMFGLHKTDGGNGFLHATHNLECSRNLFYKISRGTGLLGLTMNC